MFGPSIPIFTLLSVFAIFAVFAKIVAVVGALLTSCLTAFHWPDEFCNFLLIFCCRGPLNLLFYWFSLTRRIFPIFRKFWNFRSCVQTWTYLTNRRTKQAGKARKHANYNFQLNLLGDFFKATILWRHAIVSHISKSGNALDWCSNCLQFFLFVGAP